MFIAGHSGIASKNVPVGIKYRQYIWSPWCSTRTDYDTIRQGEIAPITMKLHIGKTS